MAELFSLLIWSTIIGIVINFLYKLTLWLYNRINIRRSVKKHWPSRPYHWFWGHWYLVELVRNKPEKMFDLVSSLAEDFKHGIGIYIGPLITMLRVTSSDVIRTVLGGSEQKYPKSLEQYKCLHPWLGDKGLLLLAGNGWQRHRKLLSNSFHFDILRSYNVKMNECAKVLVAKWKKGTENEESKAIVEVFNDFSLLTIDTLMKCLMGFECNSQIDDGIHLDYVKNIKLNSSLVIKRMRNGNPFLRVEFLYKLTKDGREYKKSCEHVREYAEQVVNLRREEYAKGVKIGAKLGLNRKQESHYDFLDVLLQAKDSNGNGLTDKEISDEVNTFIFEGHDTTASAVSWTSYCLAANPHCQEKCYEEIKSVLGGREILEYDDIPKLSYLTMCIKESLRMHPPVPSLGRMPTKDFTVDGRLVKKGTEVVISILGTHYDPTHWPDPRKFEPLRFTPENVASRAPFAYIPFSAGLRNCIGQNFAMNEIKVCMAHLLRDFEFSCDENYPMVPLVEIIFRAKDGLHLRVKRR